MRSSTQEPHASSASALAERFDVRDKLGAGGMGVVYRALDRERGSEVALKVLRHVTGRDVYRFKREFRALADVAHPNLVGLYDLHTSGDEWFLTMELVDGVSFVEWVRPRAERDDEVSVTDPSVVDDTRPTSPTMPVMTPPPGMSPQRFGIVTSPLSSARLDDALYQLVDTVHALHQAGKLHRDLKPHNILVDKTGRVVVLDFGLIADVAPVEADRTHDSSHAVGTPAYMSPEQALDAPLSPASDWYSVGVMLYEALTGRRPIDILGGDGPNVSEPVPPPERWNPEVPAPIAALCMRLLAANPDDRPAGEEILAALGREPSHASRELALSLAQVPFVGRERELDALRGAFARARAGRGAAVFLRGGSGMGKTALVRRFLEEVAAETPDAVVLRGRCYECESVPFKTLDTVVDALTAHLSGLPSAELAQLVPVDIGALARLFPATRRVPAIADGAARLLSAPDPLELRRRAFATLRVLLTRLCARAPLVIALDDLQWGDADSGNFLAELILHEQAPPLLLILTARSEDEAESPLLATLRRVRGRAQPHGNAMDVDEVTLAPLSGAESRALVRMVGGGSKLAGAHDLLRDAGGSPLFLSEMMRAGKGATGLDDAVRRRVARLPEPARVLAHVCAVAAHPLRLSLALRAAGIRQEGKLLVLLRSERLLRVRRAGDAETELESYHDRIRAAIVSGLGEEEVARLHLTLGEVLEEEAAPDHEALVVHWLAAGKPARAARHAVPAAVAAEERLAFHRAAELYQIALAHGEHDDAARVALEVTMGHALVHAGRLAEAARAFAVAAGSAVDPGVRLELRRLELEQLLRSSQYDEGLALARELLAGLGLKVPSSRGGTIRAMLGQRALLRMRGLRFVERPAAEVPIDTLRRLDLLQALALGMSFVNPVFARALQTRFVREALACGEPRRVGIAFCLELGYWGASGGKPAKLEELGQRTIALGKRMGDLRVTGHAQAALALCAFLAGRWRAARDWIAAAEPTLREHGGEVRWETDQCEFFACGIAWQMGDIVELGRRVATHLRDAEERGDVYAQRGLRAWRANVLWLAMDRPAEARAQLASAAEPLAPGQSPQLSHYYELLSAAQIDLYEGDAAGAHARVEALWPLLEAALLTRIRSVRVDGDFLRARTALAAAVTGADAAERERLVQLARGCARRLVQVKLPWADAVAAAVRAGIARVEGQATAEERALREAIAAFEAADMALHAAAARRRLAVILGAGSAEGGVLAAAAEAAFAAQAVPAPGNLCRVMLGLD